MATYEENIEFLKKHSLVFSASAVKFNESLYNFKLSRINGAVLATGYGNMNYRNEWLESKIQQIDKKGLDKTSGEYLKFEERVFELCSQFESDYKDSNGVWKTRDTMGIEGFRIAVAIIKIDAFIDRMPSSLNADVIILSEFNWFAIKTIMEESTYRGFEIILEEEMADDFIYATVKSNLPLAEQ